MFIRRTTIKTTLPDGTVIEKTTVEHDQPTEAAADQAASEAEAAASEAEATLKRAGKQMRTSMARMWKRMDRMFRDVF